MMLLDLDKIDSKRLAAVDSSRDSLSYGQIISLSEVISQSLRPRSVIFILTDNNVGGIAWIMASIISGNVPLILSHNIDSSLLSQLIDSYKPQYICRPIKISEPGIDYPVITEFGYGLSPTFEPAYEINPLLSHLLPTSGSTGSPKLIRHKYENIEASAENISTFFRLTANDRPLMVLPLHYTMGLSMVFSHLRVGATILITNLPMTDAGFWKFLKEEEATSFTGVPFSYEILDRLRFTRMNLPTLTLLTQGGGKMPENLNLKFAEYCQNTGKRWIATYGQSEGTARMAWLPEEFAISKMGSIGIAVPNGKLSLRNAEGEEIEESPATGEMCYEGRNVTMGYAFNSNDLLKGDERNGFLATGDIAYRDSDGFYYIKGRISRFLKIYGNRIGLDECESIIRSSVNCECACTGTDDNLIVYVTDSSVTDLITDLLIKTTRLPANVISIRCLEELPKNEAGKILYSKLAF